MTDERLREIAERDQLWASLRTLQPEIQRLATGQLEGSARELELAIVLARIVDSELTFRAGASASEDGAV